MVPWAQPSLNPDGISIGSAVFAGLTSLTDQGNQQTTSLQIHHGLVDHSIIVLAVQALVRVIWRDYFVTKGVYHFVRISQSKKHYNISDILLTVIAILCNNIVHKFLKNHWFGLS